MKSTEMCSKSAEICEFSAETAKRPSRQPSPPSYPHKSSSSASSSSPTSEPVSSPDTTQPKDAVGTQPALVEQQPYHGVSYHRTGEAGGFLPTMSSGLLPLDHYRLQLYNYAMVERLRNATAVAAAHQAAPPTPQQPPLCPPYAPYGPRLALSMSLFHNRVFQPEEPKPQHSYIGLIAMAILSQPEHKLVLSDIYQHILDNYPYFRTRGPGWRNSIRHNLSLNDCFIKAGRSANGKGHYWAIHPANIEDFKKGDFRRRKAQRKVRKHMGLAVDEDGADSPSPPPLSLTPPPLGLGPQVYHPLHHHPMAASPWSTPLNAVAIYSQSSRKRQFDVASLLAPDDETNYLRGCKRTPNESPSPPPATTFPPEAPHSDFEEDIDVVAHDEPAEGPLDVAPRENSWNSLMQQFPVDPRILGRYYGQYMAQQQQQRVASRRIPSNLCPDVEDAASATYKNCKND